MDGNSLTPDKVLIEQLKELMPHVFNEGKIDREKLLAAIGEDIDLSNERYVLNWAGKSDCFRVLQAPTTKTLIPAKDESVNFDETGNIFIEGENLEALKVLQKTYFGKVKMIYIDPPYNTGNDSFIYPDKFSENKEDYQKRVGDKDEEGYMTREGMFRKNSKENGQYHSNWLSMIYPRLFLARNLLRDDGVIFVSIDDNEVHNLRMVMNEIFGEENYKGTIVRASGQTTGQDSGGLGSSFDYVLLYSKNPDTELAGLPLSDNDLERYEERDEKGNYALWQLRKTGSTDRREDRPKLFFPLKDPNGGLVYPIGPTGYESRWRFDQKGVERLIDENAIVWKKRNKDGREEWWPYVKTYLDGRTKRPSPLWTDIDGSKKASIDLREIMNSKVFDNPKPVQAIKRIIQITPEVQDSDIILDFFSGSGTTAHAVLDLNREDGGNRKFICVQLPEPCDEKSEAFKAGYKTIAEIGKERIRRVINKISEEESGKLGFDDKKQDLGFKVFRLTESNFRQWRTDIKTGDELIKQMDMFKDPLREGSAGLDVVYELILKSGKDLNSSIEHKNGAYIINAGEMAVLTEKCDKKTIDAVIKLKPAKVIALDRIFKDNDQLKTNTALQMKDAGIEFKAV